MNNDENLKKDLERVGNFSIPKPSVRDRALGIAAMAERVLLRMGKIGLVLVVVTTAHLQPHWEGQETLEKIQGISQWKRTSPDQCLYLSDIIGRGSKGASWGKESCQSILWN